MFNIKKEIKINLLFTVFSKKNIILLFAIDI